MSPHALLWLYGWRLRVHLVQELLAALGVAIAVALVLATLIAAEGVSGSARAVVRAVTGPATLQLHARGPGGMPEGLLRRVQSLPAVRQAAPLLEQTATLAGPGGRSVTVDLAGADTSLVVLDGLAHTLPRATLQANGIGLSGATAAALGIGRPAGAAAHGSGGGGGQPRLVQVTLAGRARRLPVSAVLGAEAFGALSTSLVAVMPLAELQRLSGLAHRVSRILVQARPGRAAAARAELAGLAGDRLEVAAADQDVRLLTQALRPSDQASGFFAAVSAMLGLLLAFDALLLTVPERRRQIADLRLVGATRGAVAQMLVFQALVLGAFGSLIGLGAGYLLSLHAFRQPTRYLAEAFTLGGRTSVGALPLVLAFLGGMGAACLASAVPLLDLRRGRAIDAVHREREPPDAPASKTRRSLALAGAAMLALASALFAALPEQALLACVLLAAATMLLTPLTLTAMIAASRRLAQRFQRLAILHVAFHSLRATGVRPLALAGTGAIALFGSVALGGARADLMRGIEGFARSYSADAGIWVGSPSDDQAAVPFAAGALPRRISALPGVRSVDRLQGGFMELDGRRVWLLARPPGAARHVLASQIREGSPASALAAIDSGAAVAVSAQIARQSHVRVGGAITLPTPSGPVRMRVAATTTDLAWSPGAIFIAATRYRQLWQAAAPTALAVQLRPGAAARTVQAEIERLLRREGSGLQAVTAGERRASIDALTGEGLSQLAEISTLLLIAAILALAAALASAIWQRRSSLAELRLAGVEPPRLRLILLLEASMMAGAGCLTGALVGVYGQIVIDRYLTHVTGFPVASLGAGLRPLEILLLVAVAALALVATPGWIASRVSPAYALHE